MKPSQATPPKFARRFLSWFLRDEIAEEVEGDLEEKFYNTLEQYSQKRAKRNYWYQVFHYLRPFAIKNVSTFVNPTRYAMYKSYFKIGWRNLFNKKGYSFINIGGLAVGMAVTILIGLWIHDELSFNKYHQNYERISQVMLHQMEDGEKFTGSSHVTGLGTQLASDYDNYFEYVVMATQMSEHVLATDDKKVTGSGRYMHQDAPRMLTLHMQQGTWAGLEDMNSVLLSSSLAEKLFGDADPLDQDVTINASLTAKVSGVYDDLPANSEFNKLDFIAPIALFFTSNSWAEPDVWNNYYMKIYAQLLPGVESAETSSVIKDIMLAHVDEETAERNQPEVFLHPMANWRLSSQFVNGVNSASKEYLFVWFFGCTGVFVLLLACINFMNLTTARSEKRAKEVGIRKSIGSVKSQLVSQFLSESLLVVALSFILALGLVFLTLPWFNSLADKEMSMPWNTAWLWVGGIGFILFTGLLAGSYPAFYLSSFRPVSALKGTFRAGRLASLPRKILVVFQFTISTALIIGTIIVYNQIQYVKDRPVGYDQDGLLMFSMNSPEYYQSYERVRNELLGTGVVADVAKSSRPLTNALGWNNGFSWLGKSSDYDPAFNTIWVSHDYGSTIGWDMVDGRDFSRSFATDSSAIIINESALKLMGLENPVGEVVAFDPVWSEREEFTIVGVVKDMVKESPYDATYPSVIFNSHAMASWMFVRLSPEVNPQKALPQIEAVFSDLIPSVPFDYKFVDDEYDAKFRAEERVGTLAGFFAALAIFVSCLGLFGLASYVAEQRTKEIGIRKVLGATVTSLWQLLSKDFLALVLVACLLAIPISYYLLRGWLQNYEYRTEIPWWVFAFAGIGALLITLATVSYQAIKAALANPVKSLRSE